MNFDSTIDPFAIGIVGNGCSVIEFSITQALIAWLICRVDQIAVVELFAFEIALWQFGKLFFPTDFFNGTTTIQGELQFTAGLFLLSAFWTLFKVTFEAHQGVAPRIQKEKRLLLNILFNFQVVFSGVLLFTCTSCSTSWQFVIFPLDHISYTVALALEVTLCFV